WARTSSSHPVRVPRNRRPARKGGPFSLQREVTAEEVDRQWRRGSPPPYTRRPMRRTLRFLALFLLVPPVPAPPMEHIPTPPPPSPPPPLPGPLRFHDLFLPAPAVHARGRENILTRLPPGTPVESLPAALRSLEAGSSRSTSGAAAFVLGELLEARGDFRGAA